ncbi:hypothetical protein FACS189490_09860 [Clostridia bacterium]|nr:hypothetical protein FACS189490_09860 [Clostridia bacterium]
MSKVYKSGSVKSDNPTVLIEVPSAKTYSLQAEEDIKEEKAEAKEDPVKLAQEEAERIIIEAESSAAALSRRAREDAEATKVEAEEEAAAIFAEARKKGYDAGYADGVNAAEGIKNAAQRTLEDAVAERQKTLDGIEGEVVNIIAASVKKILNREAAISDKLITYLVRKGLSEMTLAGDIKIRVSKGDYDGLIENKQEILEQIKGGANIEIIKDFSLSDKDCVIETPYGNIDCSLDLQYEALTDSLFYILEHSGAQ